MSHGHMSTSRRGDAPNDIRGAGRERPDKGGYSISCASADDQMRERVNGANENCRMGCQDYDVTDHMAETTTFVHLMIRRKRSE